MTITTTLTRMPEPRPLLLRPSGHQMARTIVTILLGVKSVITTNTSIHLAHTLMLMMNTVIPVEVTTSAKTATALTIAITLAMSTNAMSVDATTTAAILTLAPVRAHATMVTEATTIIAPMGLLAVGDIMISMILVTLPISFLLKMMTGNTVLEVALQSAIEGETIAIIVKGTSLEVPASYMSNAHGMLAEILLSSKKRKKNW